jgi:hypothetical protein
LVGGAAFKDEAQSPAATRVIARARAALDRPPGAVASLHVEGTLPTQATADARHALEDMMIVRDAALAWRLTGDRAFLDQTARFLDAWTSTYQLSFNPIDETNFDALILAYDLAKPDLPKATRARMDDFLRRLASGYLEAIDTGNVKYKATLSNNWQSHRIELITLAAFELGDQDLIRRAREAFNKQIAINVRPDGSTLDFLQRDALHYVAYDLEPLLTAAVAAKVNGQDWYNWTSEQGSSLARAVAWFAPYARGEQTHVEFARSVVPFDRQRAQAGQAEYQHHAWRPAAGVGTFTLAAMLDPRYRALSEKLLAEADPKPDWMLLIGSFVAGSPK